jgi:hypothetical protein
MGAPAPRTAYHALERILAFVAVETSILRDATASLVKHLPMPALRWLARRRNRLNIVPVLVYQMAKVGSSSVVAALSRLRLPVFHVHRMDAEHLAEMRASRRALGWHIPPVPAHDLLGLRLRRDVIDRGGRAAIITLVRDPIARNISSYFEHLDSIWRRRDAHASVPVADLIEGFRTRYPHDEPLTWLDDELRKVTGIDLYSVPFPQCGHLTISQGNIALLVLKNELADATKENALAEFVGVPALSLERTNRTGDKAKGAVYREFLGQLQLDESYLGRMLESRYARHFYSSAEREQLWRRYAPG